MGVEFNDFQSDGNFFPMQMNLPLNAGINVVTLATTNAFGLGSVTNFTIVQRSASLTVDPLSQSNQSVELEITGTVSENGIQT